MFTKIDLDCPYCHNACEHNHAVAKHVNDPDTAELVHRVGPFFHDCDDCGRTFCYLVEVDFQTTTHSIGKDALKFKKKGV